YRDGRSPAASMTPEWRACGAYLPRRHRHRHLPRHPRSRPCTEARPFFPIACGIDDAVRSRAAMGNSFRILDRLGLLDGLCRESTLDCECPNPILPLSTRLFIRRGHDPDDRFLKTTKEKAGDS